MSLVPCAWLWLSFETIFYFIFLFQWIYSTLPSRAFCYLLWRYFFSMRCCLSWGEPFVSFNNVFLMIKCPIFVELFYFHNEFDLQVCSWNVLKLLIFFDNISYKEKYSKKISFMYSMFKTQEFEQFIERLIPCFPTIFLWIIWSKNNWLFC